MFEYLVVLIIIVVVLVIVFYSLNSWYFPNKRLEKIMRQLNYDLQQHGTMIEVTNGIADLKFTLNETDYLIKVIKCTARHNIVITNKTTWIKTERTGALDIKNRIKEIEPFLLDQSHHDTENKIEKIVLVYPDAKGILRYINENEMVFVTKELDLFGLRVVRFNELSDYIQNLQG